jgi:hypothetical protein
LISASAASGALADALLNEFNPDIRVA